MSARRLVDVAQRRAKRCSLSKAQFMSVQIYGCNHVAMVTLAVSTTAPQGVLIFCSA